VAELVAAVDCGTNSTRLLIGDGQRTVERLMHITRMGEGVDATGRLSQQAMDRVLEVLRGYRAAMDRHGVTRCW
jgi:exopolyphosphatase/guanosine-5'-triphosphate,3'-diphosphate pyrophosphatase